jgi:hypothetical protein
VKKPATATGGETDLDEIEAALRRLDFEDPPPETPHRPPQDAPSTDMEGGPGRPGPAAERPPAVLRSPSGNRTHDPEGPDGSGDEARQIAERHRLPLDVARLVASGRLTVPSARAIARVRETSERVDRERAKSRSRRVFALSLLLLAVATLAAYRARTIWNEQVEATHAHAESMRSRTAETSHQSNVAPLTPAPESAGPARSRWHAIVRDDSGNLVAVADSDPRSVLRHFCQASGRCSVGMPVEVVRSDPARAGRRYGLFHDVAGGGAPRAVAIRRDSLTGAWSAGDGENPIRVLETGRLRLDARRIPVALPESYTAIHAADSSRTVADAPQP